MIELSQLFRRVDPQANRILRIAESDFRDLHIPSFSRSLERGLAMTIEIHKPELKALIEERMQTGAYQNIDDLLIQALTSASPPIERPRRTPAEAAARIRQARIGTRLPPGVTIRGLIDKGRD